MREYIARRIIYALITIFAVATILFVMFRMMPGDPTAQVISPALDEASQARLREAFGLNEPIWMQYLIYLKNVVTLDWGRSFQSSEKVFDVLMYRFWNTLLLMAAGMFLTLFIGIFVGMVMGWKRGGKLDNWVTIVAMIFQSAPPFITGVLLLIVLSYRLDLLPTGGMSSPGNRPTDLLVFIFSKDFWSHLALPTIAITAYYLATPLLIMRDSMLEVLGSDFVEFAKAKGLPPHQVMIRHAARNALLAVVTVSSILLGFAIGGQVIVETVFSWPGMGLLMVEASAAHDYPVAQASFLLLAALVIFTNLLADISYVYLDPRIKLG